MKQTALALDLGGTKLRVGTVDSDGRMGRVIDYPSGPVLPHEAVALLLRSIESFLSETSVRLDDLDVVGIGMIGRVDFRRGILDLIDQSRRGPVEVARPVGERFALPCAIDNDVKAATLAEQRYGAGKGVSDFVFLNIGTGIAAGFVVDGELIRGWQNDSGEIGHTSVAGAGELPCVCGRFGCVETIASGGGMERRARALAARYPGSPLAGAPESQTIPAEAIFSHADSGDPLALAVSLAAVGGCAELILDLVRISNPRRIVLGGGVASNEWFRRELLRRLELPVMASVDRGVVPSQLSPADVGLVGAATVGFRLLGREE